MAFKLLCCDGGGIRGLMTALLIQDLDRRFGVIGKADGFAGTSTGGLIALALARGQSIDALVEIYLKDGSTIFEPNGWLADERSEGPHPDEPEGVKALESGPGFLSCQYRNDGLAGLAKQLLGPGTLAETDPYVAVNSARLWDGSSWQGATLSNAAHNPYRDVKLHDAALATSAAPTYFPPHAIPGLGFFADGGTFANNPCMTALADAFAGKRFASLDDTVTLSLGTGVVPTGIRPGAVSDPLDWGVTHWMWPWSFDKVPSMALLDLMMACTSQAATRQARDLLASRFCRGNVTLTRAIPLDAWQQVDALQKDAEQYMQGAEWAGVRAWVQQHWV